MVRGPAFKRVALVGCGNIGFRHLQALTGMSTPTDLTVIEPATQAHPRIEALIAQTPPESPHRIRLLDGVAAIGGTGGEKERIDLAVIATDARHRLSAWNSLCDRVQVRAVIFEKILFPSVAEIDAVQQDLTRRGIEGYVNCGRRGFPDYQALSNRFGGAGIPVDVQVVGAQFGLASNTVHFLDLAEFLNGAALTSVDLTGLDPGSVASKRAGYVEIFGTVRATLVNGARVSITCRDADQMAVRLRLSGRDGAEIDIDEVNVTMTEAGQIKPLGLRFVSEMSELYETILHGHGSALTDYAASARQHRLYLGALRDHLGLPDRPETPLPVS